MKILKESSVVFESVEVSDICQQAIEQLMDIDDGFRLEEIKVGQYRIFYNEKSILTVEVFKNNSDGSGAVTVTDYQDRSEMFNLNDNENILDYIIDRATIIL